MKETVVTTIQNTSEKKQQEAPLYISRTAAGFGVPGDDTVDDSLNLHEYLVNNESATFFVRVTGDSMEGAKIFDNDILVVDRSVTPKNGSIVVVAVNGELVVKRIQINTGKATLLVSENPAYEPIALTDSDECFLWGVVVGAARKLT